MSHAERDRDRLFARITTGGMYHNSNGHPRGEVAVFTTGYAHVGNSCVYLHCIALFIDNRSSSQRHDLHHWRSVREDISAAS